MTIYPDEILKSADWTKSTPDAFDRKGNIVPPKNKKLPSATLPKKKEKK